MGWSAFGFAARCYQLAIMKRNLFENLGGHALSVGAFAGLGYAYYGAESRVNEMLEERKAALRELRGQTATAAASEGSDDE